MEQKIFLQREQQHEVMLGDGGVIYAGREEQWDAELGAGLDVNLVHADAVFAQEYFSFGRAFSKTLRVMASSPQVCINITNGRASVSWLHASAARAHG